MQKRPVNLKPLLKNLKSLEQNMLQLQARNVTSADIVAQSGMKGKSAKTFLTLLGIANQLSQLIIGSGKSLSFNTENPITEPRVSNGTRKSKTF
jgi:hypothetical protein